MASDLRIHAEVGSRVPETVSSVERKPETVDSFPDYCCWTGESMLRGGDLRAGGSSLKQSDGESIFRSNEKDLKSTILGNRSFVVAVADAHAPVVCCLLTTHGMLFGTGFSACDFWKIADS